MLVQRTVLVIALLGGAALVAGCSQDRPPSRARSAGSADSVDSAGAAARAGGPIRVVDGAGRSVTLESPARRVVSLMPSVSEWVIAMGAAPRLIARTDYDDHPAIDTLPSVGGGLSPSVEWLAARRPDLVVAWPDAPSRSVIARLAALDIAVYAAPSETIGEAMAVAADMGRLLGLDAAAGAAIEDVRAGLERTRRRVAGERRPAVLFLIGLDPLMAAGPGTFVAELLDVAGGENVLADLDIRWPQLSLEEVVRRDPEVVIVGTASRADPLAALRDRPGWRQVRAVRAGRVHAVDPNVINRPGPRMDDAAAELADLIHPRTRDGGDR